LAQVFVRKTSGLVRDIGALDAFLISVGSIAPTVFAIMTIVSWTTVLYPGADLMLSLFIGMLPMLVFGLTYALLGAAMPRSGGDYVWISRTVNPLIGYTCSWAFTLLVIISMGLDMTYTTSIMLSIPLVVLGNYFSNPGLVAFGTTVYTNPNYTFLVAALFIASGGVILIFGKKALSVVMRCVFFIQMLSVVIFCGLLIGVTPQSFAPVFGSYTGVSVAKIMSQASSAGWAPPTFSLYAAISTMPLMVFLYNGLSYPTVAAGEIKRVSRSLMIAVVGGLIFSWIVNSIGAWLMLNAFGYNFLQATYYLSANGQWSLPAPPYGAYFASMLTNNLAVLLLLNVGLFLSLWILELVKYFIITRTLFAWSFDRMVPRFVADVSTKYFTPTKAIAIAGILTIVAAAADVYTPYFAYYLNTYSLSCVVWAVGGIAALIFPFVRKEAYSTSPIKYEIGKIPVISILGAIQIPLMLFIAYNGLTNPILAPVSTPAYAMSIIFFASGIVAYLVARWYRSRRGLDISLVFKEVPPM